MLSIKVLGTGCAKCFAVERVVVAALEALAEENPNLEATLEHIEAMSEIEKYPVLFTPALIVNEKVVCDRRVPQKEEVVRWYREALDQTH